MQHATNDMLAKDLYTLTGQFKGFESQMDELRSLVKDGFDKIDNRFDQLEKWKSETEAEHFERKGQRKTMSWMADLIKGIVYAILGAVAGAVAGAVHFFK